MSDDDNSGGRQSARSLLERELTLLCQSELLSEEGLRGKINHHGLTSNNTFIRKFGFFCAACGNERVTEGIIQCLLEYFPEAASATNENGWSPLHAACGNKNVTLNVIQLLIDVAPDSVRSVTNNGDTPLHVLCLSRKWDEAAAIEILKFLLQKHSEAVRHADNRGSLPPLCE